MNKLLNFIRQNFISGLAVFVPFVITTYLVLELGKWLNSLVILTPARFVQLPDVISPFFTEIILFLVAAFSFIFLITLLGLGTKNLLGKLLVRFGEKTISKIPLANAIFTTTKEISKIVFAEGEKQKNVVLVEYPRKGSWAVGFATKDNKGEISKRTNQKLVNVFIPTTPNPTSGFLLMFPKEDIIYLDMDFEEASKFIVSAGTSDPKS